ncbi:MAG: hypothetical protein HOU81_25100 [Hamadaea sp.]|uniref:hypothetical protein n=1 Tax=Hamadaea sp. TaxID=2024425 RepID=UPI00182C929D|nr:hypothetical protein [Hamadaea sp.]NUR74101.1 hypothetical protein [Hamadaea sp.]NUT19992.1 hypothetical protein [Hamadaea sp.]
MAKRWMAAAVIAVALAAGASGCGDDSTTTGSGSGPAASTGKDAKAGKVKACDLLTPADVAGLLGADSPKPSKQSAKECVYTNGTKLAQIAVEPGTFDAAVMKTVLGDRAVKVEGLGDVAYTFQNQAIGQTHVWAKGQYLTLSVSATTADDTVAASKQLAEKAVGRL